MVKVLLISDVPDKKYWDFYEQGMLKDIDLIMSCGDLPPQYLSFLVTFASCPLVYVRGNHDDCYEQTPPEGCVCIENKIYKYKGIKILGLGGSMRYKPGRNQYSEREMKKRIRGLRLKLLFNRGFDVLLTHSPARDMNDGKDMPHMGFKSFYCLLDKYSPKYFIHGHMHLNYNQKIPRVCEYKNTIVINGYQSYLFDIDV